MAMLTSLDAREEMSSLLPAPSAPVSPHSECTGFVSKQRQDCLALTAAPDSPALMDVLHALCMVSKRARDHAYQPRHCAVDSNRNCRVVSNTRW